MPLPEGATALVYSRGSVPATTLGMLEKGFTTVTAASKTAYTAVPGDQIGVDTVANIVTITLPAGAVGVATDAALEAREAMSKSTLRTASTNGTSASSIAFCSARSAATAGAGLRVSRCSG